MKTLAQQILDKRESSIVRVARKHHTSYNYVWKIASGQRKPIRGKGLEILHDLERIANQKKLRYEKVV